MRTNPIRWVMALVVAPVFLLISCVGGAFNRAPGPIIETVAIPAEPTVSRAEVSSDVYTPEPLPTSVDTVPSSNAPQVTTPTLQPTLPDGCDTPDGLSRPQEMQVGDTGLRSVVGLPRENGNSPVPPNFAKDIYAWDNEGGEIGYDQYRAYFTAHTYSSDETALGNVLQAQVIEGDLARVTNTDGGVICYEVFERIEVLESDYLETVMSRPSEGVLVIQVCSGLEGRDWTKRTIWFAKIVEPA